MQFLWIVILEGINEGRIEGKIVANTPVSKNSNTSSSFKIRENHLGSGINYNKRIKPINR